MSASRAQRKMPRPTQMLETVLTGQTKPREKLAQIDALLENLNPQQEVSIQVGDLREFAGQMRNALGPRIFQPRNLVITLLILAVAVGFAVIGFTSPWIYEWVWGQTTGRPYTHIMRDYPTLYAVPAVGVIGLLLPLPFHYWTRAIVIAVVFAIAFVGGHALWCGS